MRFPIDTPPVTDATRPGGSGRLALESQRHLATVVNVSDLFFPGNVQEIMNRVLVAKRTSRAALSDARTRVEGQRIDNNSPPPLDPGRRVGSNVGARSLSQAIAPSTWRYPPW